MINSIDSIMYNLSMLNERNAKVNAGLSSGKALEYGSDNSVQYSYVLGIQSDLGTFGAINDHITLSKAFNTSSDDALKSIKETTRSIIEELITANNDTTVQSDKEIIANQIESYKSALYSLANTNVDGQYVFSGINTDVQPFSQDPSTGTVSFQSNYTTKTLNVEENTYVQQGINGIDVFYYETDSAASGGTFTYSENDIILDENGNQWKLLDTTLPTPDGIYDGLYLNGDSTALPVIAIDSFNADGTFTSTNSATAQMKVQHSMFDDIDKVVAALNLQDTSGAPITEAEAKVIISDAQEKMKTAFNQEDIAHSIVGNRTNTINTYGDIVSSKITNLEVLDLEYGQADYTKLAIDSKSIETTMTAIYATIQRVDSLSLVKYMS